MKPTPDILNSKIKKIRIELPHYSFSHSASGDSPHAFIGRERIREKIKKVVEDSPDEPGVYLIAGNRGVGKTSLISWVINETSLKPNSGIIENIKYLLLLFLAVAGTNRLTKFFLNDNNSNLTNLTIFWSLIFTLFFILLCCFNSYRRKYSEPKQCFLDKVKYCVKTVFNGITSAFIELSYLTNPYNPYGKTQYLLKIILIVSFTQIFYKNISQLTVTALIAELFGYLIIFFVFIFFRFIRNIFHKDKLKTKKKKYSKDNNIFFIKLKNIILIPIKNYIKNHSRLYLRINFGHKLNDEKDILRLITRTLSAEYKKYHRSINILPWRIIAFVFIFIFAYFFSPIIEKQNFYKKFCNSIKSKEQSEVDFSNIENMVVIEIVKIEDSINEVQNKHIILKPKLSNKVSTKIGNILYAFDQLFMGIGLRIDYLLWLSFILIYIFFVIIFNCNWITPFLVTHRIIMKRLKKLNSDIIHSTERERSIGVNNEKNGPILGIRAKKSRNVADAREIEKELQDILYDIRRIPVIMCRPNIVIVFDELDKVEPGDASEKENSQTKAALFSIHATRDRQTEILRILSNMKYFLSTARAKFIFIAGREMFDIHLADVSERNNYIGSIFNVVILVPSFLSDHHTGKKSLPQESSIASLPEEFVCRRLIPHDYPVEAYDLENYRVYLDNVIYKDLKDKKQKIEIVQKVIAVLQQFIIYLAHVSKGAPKKMMQLFESFIEIRNERDNKNNILLVQRYHSSQRFLSFNYYKQYTLGIIAYLITPIFFRLAESNIKELSDKLLVSSLRFVDFLFKFHKNSFSWKHLDMSPEMLEVNRAPELKSVAVDLLNYLAQVHINKSNFSLSEYKFDGLIANEIFAMAKTDEVFSALFSFSLDETLPLKKHYQDLLENTKKEYQKEDKSEKYSDKYIDAISSLQGVLGDLHYYDDELEEAEAYYKSAVQALRENEKMTMEQLYVYIRNMLRLGIIYEKRKQYDFAYLTYGELCKRIIQGRDIYKYSPQPLYYKEISPYYDSLLKKMTFEGLKMIYLPFIAKLQILELSHMGGITRNHLEQLDKEFKFLTYDIDHEEAKLLEAEFYSRVADVLYYKNSDLKCKKKKKKYRKDDKDEYKYEEEKCDNNINADILPENCSCTACYYYHKALSTLLGKPDYDKLDKKSGNTVKILLCKSIEQLKKNDNKNCNMKFYTILARILSDWGNVFFSCDIKDNIKEIEDNKFECYIGDGEICNTINSVKEENKNGFLENCIKYLEAKEENGKYPSLEIDQLETKKDAAFAMYSISSSAYRRVSLYKRSSYQIYKMLRLFKDYKIYNCNYFKQLSERAIHYLWRANDDLKVLELNKRKKDFDKVEVDKIIPLQYLLVDNEITRIWIIVKELELKSYIDKKSKVSEHLKEYYDIRITSPYKINYSIVGSIFRLWLKSKVNYITYQQLIGKSEEKENILSEIKYIFENERCNETAKEIFGKYFNFNNERKAKIKIFENLLAETIYCLIDITQLTETMDETYTFTHYFFGSIHDRLSFWIRRYEEYEKYKRKNPEIKKYSKISEYLKQYLDEEWREQLSGYRENQRALSHYSKSLEMHHGGRTYHNMIDTMCYIRDDFNDRSDHFNIAEERHLIINGKVMYKINKINNNNDSKLHKIENYLK